MTRASPVPDADHVHFLGTGGARVVVSKQARASGGVWYSLGGQQILVDPGPGSIVQCARCRPPRELTSINHLIVTHRHIDHCADVNAVIDGMTLGGWERRGFLYAPADALDDDPVVLLYLRDFLLGLRRLEERARFELGDGITLHCPLRHDHQVETYGLLFETPTARIAHIIDTRWFPELAENYRCDLLVLNVVLIHRDHPRARHVPHLTVADAQRLVADIRPSRAVITHMGMGILNAGPDRIAQQMSDATGIPVMAAEDGMTLPVHASRCD